MALELNLDAILFMDHDLIRWWQCLSWLPKQSLIPNLSKERKQIVQTNWLLMTEEHRDCQREEGLVSITGGSRVNFGRGFIYGPPRDQNPAVIEALLKLFKVVKSRSYTHPLLSPRVLS